MLGGLVESRLADLELLPQGPRTLREPLEILGARLERGDCPVNLCHATLRPLDSSKRAGYQLFDPGGFISAGGHSPESLVGAVHAGEQPARPLVQLSTE